MIFESRNPANESLFEAFEELTDEQLEQRLQRAAAAAKDWRARSFAERGEILMQIAAELRNHKAKLAAIITGEMGKRKAEAEGEIEKCALVCEYYAEEAEAMLRDETIETSAHHSYVTFEPMGTLLAIMPWNFPFWQVFRCLAPALMAGNTLLLKHAPNVPRCALAIEQVLTYAGLPSGVFYTLLIAEETAADVLADERVHGVSFTGSEATGRKIATMAGQHLKKAVLELGGSDPYVVLEDADLDKAVATGVRSKFNNAGQVCVAAKRFILVDAIADDFISRFKEQVAALQMGDPSLEDTTLSPMARADLRDRLDEQVQASIAEGAVPITGCHKVEGPGYFYEPSILSGVKPGMTAFDEELFGPVAAFITARDEEEALQLANQTRYGLSACVWSGDLARGEAFARRMEAGCCFVNALPTSDIRMPFGGVKASGLGRELSSYGVREFCHVKSMWHGGQGD